MCILSILARHHKKWINIVENFGANPAISEDIVQETYIKILGMKDRAKMLYNEADVNHFYMYLTLRSVYIDYCRKNRPVNEDSFVDLEQIDVDMDREMAFERLYQKVIDKINGFGKYGSILSQMYFKTDYSLRNLSEMSEIGMYSLYNSIKKYRKAVQDDLGEDFEDFKNGDYDKI